MVATGVVVIIGVMFMSRSIVAYNVRSIELINGTHVEIRTAGSSLSKPGTRVPVPLLSEHTSKNGLTTLRVGSSKSLLQVDTGAGEVHDAEAWDSIRRGHVYGVPEGLEVGTAWWHAAKDESGSVYYFHEVTGETSWKPPSGWKPLWDDADVQLGTSKAPES
jgi:hypothetical protein